MQRAPSKKARAAPPGPQNPQAPYNPELADLSESGAPRLSVYLLLDRSPSMIGAPIAALNEGLATYIREMTTHQQAARSIEVTLVAFPGDEPGQPYTILTGEGPVPIKAMLPPTLQIKDGGTPMGAAIVGALNLVEARLSELKAANIGRFKPMMVVMTDGEPTDDVSAARARLAQLDLPSENGKARGRVAAFGMFVKSSPEDAIPSQMDGLFRQNVKGVSVASMRAFWSWLSRSCVLVSQSNPVDAVKLAPTGDWET